MINEDEIKLSLVAKGFESLSLKQRVKIIDWIDGNFCENCGADIEWIEGDLCCNCEKI